MAIQITQRQLSVVSCQLLVFGLWFLLFCQINRVPKTQDLKPKTKNLRPKTNN